MVLIFVTDCLGLQITKIPEKRIHNFHFTNKKTYLQNRCNMCKVLVTVNTTVHLYKENKHKQTISKQVH